MCRCLLFPLSLKEKRPSYVHFSGKPSLVFCISPLCSIVVIITRSIFWYRPHYFPEAIYFAALRQHTAFVLFSEALGSKTPPEVQCMPVAILPTNTVRPSDKVTFPPTTSRSKTEGTGMKHTELLSGKIHFRIISCPPRGAGYLGRHMKHMVLSEI